MLIAAGASPEQEDLQCGTRPIHQAAIQNHYSAVKALLGAGIDPLAPKPNCDGIRGTSHYHIINYRPIGNSPLEAACLNGCLETVEVLLSHINDTNLTQQALAWAAGAGQSRVVSSILRQPGVAVNTKIDGATPIYLACKAYSAPTVEALLQAGADPNIRNENAHHRNCLHEICQAGASSSCIPNYANSNVLNKIFSLLIKHGVNVNDRIPSGRTALHGAAIGSSVLTQLLVDAGADANAIDSEGSTPLFMMLGYDSHRSLVDPMVILIEQGGANINHTRENGDTVLHYIVDTLTGDRVLTFLKYEPDCNVLDRQGNSPLHNAIRGLAGYADVIEALLKAGADPNMKNCDGLAPLVCLRSFDNSWSLKPVEILVAAGADLNTVDCEGKTLLFHLLPCWRLLWHDDSAIGKFRELANWGALIPTRDFKGRTILHEMVQGVLYNDKMLPQEEMPSKSDLNILDDLGLDLKAVDFAGNGLLHEVASRRDKNSSAVIILCEYLVAMGLDMEQKNNAGRTPMHILCTNGGYDLIPKTRKPLLIDLLIGLAKNFNAPDNGGITPLHIAATRGELYTKKLLDAGADPTACTREGFTALHLACRWGQSNVVGILLDALGREEPVASGAVLQHAQPGSRPASPQIRGVNAKAYCMGNFTPLFYACRSGRPETVALLIQAGADAVVGEVLQACIGFEGESRLCTLSEGFSNGIQRTEDDWLLLGNSHAIPPRGLCDIEPGAPDFDLSTIETSRIEEILEMFAESGSDLSRLFCHGKPERLINQAAASGRDYTARCLRAIRDKYSSRQATPMQENLTGALSGIMQHFLDEASVQTLNISQIVEQGAANQELCLYFLRRREYYMVTELFHLGADFLRIPGDKKPCNLTILIRGGLVSLVENVSDLVVKSALNNSNWRSFGDSARPGLWYAKRDSSNPDNVPVPFLLEAVQRELPNLEMMRLLIEKFSVDINECRFSRRSIRIPSGMLYNQQVPIDSAVHYAARGNSWWHANQALPYLIEAGADINNRNYKEETPLHIALSNNVGPFAKHAARTLIENGADVNATSREGQSILACAVADVDMIRLLVSHGANLSADAMFAAITASNVVGAEELLSAGAGASMRRGKLLWPEFDSDGERTHPIPYSVSRSMGVPLYQEVFPLYHAVMFPELRSRERIVTLLLDHGADPFAKFLSQINRAWEDSYACDTTRDTPSIEVPEDHRECTILHELLLGWSATGPFFGLPGLDVNHRDAKGRTLLLAACQGLRGPDAILGSDQEAVAVRDGDDQVTIFQHLISLGASLGVRDNSGRNVLHGMIATENFGAPFKNFKHSFVSALQEAPDLINQRDNNGQTPLHYSVIQADKTGDTLAAQALRSAGADLLAVDRNGNSVLHVLAKSLVRVSQLGLFQTLAEDGIDINARNTHGETPLLIFCKQEKTELRESYYDCLERENVPYKEVLIMLKGLGADFFTTDNRGQGLLHVAARTNDATFFKMLLDEGLDAMLEDEGQQTPADVAAVSGSQEVLEVFETNFSRK